MTKMTSDVNNGHSNWTTEVSELRNGVNVARAISSERLNDLPILVVNSGDQPCEMQADTILTELTFARCTDENDDETLTSSDGKQSYLHLSNFLEKIDEILQNMLRAGVIEQSCCPWTSNVVVVAKKDGSLRFWYLI